MRSGELTSNYRTRAATLLAVAALAPAIAGCGDGDELSTDEYNTQLEQVFIAFNRELPKATSELTADSSLEQRAAALADGQPVIERAEGDLESLEPPPELADLHERLVSLVESFGEATSEAREAAEAGDAERLTEYEEATSRFQRELVLLGQDFQEAGLGLTPGAQTGTPTESSP